MMPLDRQAGLYLHIPFCRRKCSYCSFYSFTPQAVDIKRFLSALQVQIQHVAADTEIRNLTFASIFFGGGTPSLLPVEALAKLLRECRRAFPFVREEPEISIEVNPATIDAAGLYHLRQAGCNRLSIGVQSFDDQDLLRIGRLHTSAEAVALIGAVRQAGFDNYNLDLMYGLPGQSTAGWQENLECALALHPTHLSLYELTLEAGTPLSQQQQQGQAQLPTEDEVLEMMAITEQTIAASDLHRYEISNYALPGHECRHNINYWKNGSYLGIGPGAVSALSGIRRTALADFDRWVGWAGQHPAHQMTWHDMIGGHKSLPSLRSCRKKGRVGRAVSCPPNESTPWQEEERLDHEAAFRETVVMGLRMLEGVSLADLAQRFGLDLLTYYGPTIDRLLTQDLLLLQGDRVLLSERGLPLANQVMAQLV
jgi:oxygen-independent coproporphyrinogen-3 oxidase